MTLLASRTKDAPSSSRSRTLAVMPRSLSVPRRVAIYATASVHKAQEYREVNPSSVRRIPAAPVTRPRVDIVARSCPSKRTSTESDLGVFHDAGEFSATCLRGYLNPFT